MNTAARRDLSIKQHTITRSMSFYKALPKVPQMCLLNCVVIEGKQSDRGKGKLFQNKQIEQVRQRKKNFLIEGF